MEVQIIERLSGYQTKSVTVLLLPPNNNKYVFIQKKNKNTSKYIYDYTCVCIYIYICVCVPKIVKMGKRYVLFEILGSDGLSTSIWDIRVSELHPCWLLRQFRLSFFLSTTWLWQFVMWSWKSRGTQSLDLDIVGSHVPKLTSLQLIGQYIGAHWFPRKFGEVGKIGVFFLCLADIHVRSISNWRFLE